MKPELIFALGSALIIGFVIGGMVFDAPDAVVLRECAKKHNVYACEYVALPKKPSLIQPPPARDLNSEVAQ